VSNRKSPVMEKTGCTLHSIRNSANLTLGETISIMPVQFSSRTQQWLSCVEDGRICPPTSLLRWYEVTFHYPVII
jgi:hypothetical protein